MCKVCSLGVLCQLLICLFTIRDIQEEVRKFLKEDDKALIRTSDGFRIKRKGREDVIYRGEIKSLHCLRDEYILEVFVNGGEKVYTALL